MDKISGITQIFRVSHRNLKILAALMWYGGSIALFAKAGSLLREAYALQPKESWPWLAVVIGLILGGVKGHFLFAKSCRRNLKRINNICQPKFWQFFKPAFFIFMALMITFGATLSRLAHGNYSFLLGVAVIDLSIAVALLWSSRIFWQPNDQK